MLDLVKTHPAATPQGKRTEAVMRQPIIRIEHNGESLTVAQWAKRLNMCARVIYQRIKRDGWTPEQAVTRPKNFSQVPHNTKIYTTWSSMKKRCLSHTHKAYPYYGGRGITVCDRWLRSVIDFYTDVGDPPTDKHTLDRINNDGNYEPGNIRWATRSEQNQNTRVSKRYEALGECLTITEWSLKSGIARKTLKSRLTEGWTILEAIQPDTRAPRSYARRKRVRHNENASS